MFEFLKKKETGPDTCLYAPASGRIMKMEEVNDPMFSQKMMGDGFAVYPNYGRITSPVEGTVLSVFPTKHAIGLKTDHGDEIILHIGIDTVNLKGVPFKMHVKEGDRIDSRKPLVDMDLEYLRERNVDPSVIVVLTNASEGFAISAEGTVTSGQNVGKVLHQHTDANHNQ